MVARVGRAAGGGGYGTGDLGCRAAPVGRSVRAGPTRGKRAGLGRGGARQRAVARLEAGARVRCSRRKGSRTPAGSGRGDIGRRAARVRAPRPACVAGARGRSSRPACGGGRNGTVRERAGGARADRSTLRCGLDRSDACRSDRARCRILARPGHLLGRRTWRNGVAIGRRPRVATCDIPGDDGFVSRASCRRALGHRDDGRQPIVRDRRRRSDLDAAVGDDRTTPARNSGGSVLRERSHTCPHDSCSRPSCSPSPPPCQ